MILRFVNSYALSLFFLAYYRCLTSAEAICGLMNQRTAVVNDRLLFSSGNYTFDDGKSWQNTSSLYWIMLNQTIDVDKPLDLSLFQTSDLPGTTLTGGEPPKTGGSTGTYFYDHEVLYPYAAMIGPEANDIYNEIWSFNTSRNEWKIISVEGGRISYASNSDGVFAVDVKNGVSFYTGGWLMATENSTNGTVKFQSENSPNPQWSFMTAQEGLQGPHILQGVMTYVRKGESGVLIAFGGYDTERKGSQFSDWDWDQREMSEIWIYDIFSNMWYQEQATGDVPPRRSEFCAVVSSAPDDSSFQITIHGGWDRVEDQSYDDIYVLSIPSFRWIRINGSDPMTNPGRSRHKCDMWNDAQMIVSGGRVSIGVGNETTVLNNKCNSTHPPFKVLDTSTYTWRTKFEPSIEYFVPDAVAAIIGGSSTGNATLNTPQNGWNSSDLATVFSKTVERDTYTYNPDALSTTSASSDSNSLSGGTIAGIVVAVVIAVLIAAGAAAYFWIIRKRRKRQSEAEAREARLREAQMAEKPELDSKEKARFELSPESAIFEAEMGKVKPAELEELKEKNEPVELPADTATPELPG